MYAAARKSLQSSLGRQLVACRRQGQQQPLLQSLQLTIRRTMADMPVPQSSKAVLFGGHPRSEGWESTMAIWYGTSSLLLVAILGMTPDSEIETWAKQEAAARLGMSSDEQAKLEFGTHYLTVKKQKVAQNWDKFSSKATRWDADDDDDDDEE
jgi:hypothetical protein